MAKALPKTLKIKFKRPVINRMEDLISQTFGLYFKHFLIVLQYFAIFYIPAFLIKNYLLFLFPVESKLFKIFIAAAVLGVIGSVAIPALFYTIIQTMNKKKTPPFMESLQWSFHCWSQNFGNNLIVYFFIVIGLLLLVIPGIIFSIWYSLITPIVTVEGRTQRDVLERSKSLVKGREWLIFGSSFVLGLAQAVAALMIAISLGFIGGLTGVITKSTVLSDHWILITVTDFTTHMLFSVVMIMSLVAYLSFSSKNKK
ncbi:MAG TPA: hypothetical protein VK791_04205 [bacterium]|jgi:hypothetical protein|nr:hypothetical protein [bacterium]